MRAGTALLQDAAAPRVDVRPQLAKSGVGAVDVGLLELELGLLRHRAPERIGAVLDAAQRTEALLAL